MKKNRPFKEIEQRKILRSYLYSLIFALVVIGISLIIFEKITIREELKLEIEEIREIESLIIYPEEFKKVKNNKEIEEFVIEETDRREVILEVIQETFGKNWKIAYAVANAESQLKPDAVGYNTDKRKTIDRGLFQINDYWHSEVSNECAYDLVCNIKEAYRISKGGTDWTPWVTYNNKLYLHYLNN